MVWIVLLVILVALIYLPQFWVQRVLKKHSNERSDFPGTGGEFARHLIKQQGLNVKLETTEQGDHYDPISKTVRLSSENFNGKSLTAVATAAHEVGHAIQHQQGMALLLLRTPLANIVAVGLMPGMAILEKDGQRLVIKAGQEQQGITLIRADSEQCVIEINGTRQTLLLGASLASSYTVAQGKSVRLQQDFGGHYYARVKLNGRTVRMLVDTGATRQCRNH